jgi:hypothetical protein
MQISVSRIYSFTILSSKWFSNNNSLKYSRVCGIGTLGKRELTSNETKISLSMSLISLILLIKSNEFWTEKLDCFIGKLLNSFVNHLEIFEVGALIAKQSVSQIFQVYEFTVCLENLPLLLEQLRP